MSFKTHGQLQQHPRHCPSNNTKSQLQGKRKLKGHGYQQGATVRRNLSRSETKTLITSKNTGLNTRAATYNTKILWSKPSVHKIARERLLQLISQEVSVEDEFNFETGSPDHFEDDQYVAEMPHVIGNNNTAPSDGGSQDGADTNGDEEEQLNNVVDSDGVDRDDDDEEDDDDWVDIDGDQLEGWVDIGVADPHYVHLSEVQKQHGERWIKYKEGDGLVIQKDHAGRTSLEGNVEEDNFTYKNNLPPYIIAQISLLKILSQHKGNDLKLFDRIMAWVGFFSDKHPDIWITRKKFNCHTRKTTVPFIAEFFNSKDLYPTPKDVNLCDGSTVTVPIFPFDTMLKDILNDPNIINDDNLIQENFDKTTWRPTKMYTDLGQDDVINDLNTGLLYQRGIELYCDDKPPPGIARILPCPIIFFSDESHHDNNSGNKTGPVSMTVGMLNSDERAKYPNWRNIGFIPNYGLGKGKNANQYDDEWVRTGKKRGKKTLNPKEVAQRKVKDHQTLYRTVLQPFIDFCDQYGGLRYKYKGELCLVKPFFLMLIGDAKEYNIVCNHYNTPGNKRIRCPIKQCLCSHEDLGTVIPPVCTPITLADVERSMRCEDFAKRISQHQVRCVWNELPIADDIQGVAGMTPFESLHVNGQGNFADGPNIIREMIGEGKTKKAEKESLELLFQTIAGIIGRNSERRIPKYSIRFGALDNTRLTAGERKGVYFLLAISLRTKRGAEIMRDFLKKRRISMTNVIGTMSLLLAYDAWTKGSAIKKWELDNAGPAVAKLMKDMIQYLPMPVCEGSNGYHKIKFHALWLFLHFMKKYGSARNFDGEHGERFHKESVKKNGDQTQRRPCSFTAQCGDRDGESNIIDHAFKYVAHECPPDTRHKYTISSAVGSTRLDGSVQSGEDVTMLGKYVLHCPPATGRSHEVDYAIEWKNRAKVVADIKLNSHLLHGLTSYALKREWRIPYQVEGYTEIKVDSPGGSTIYRASEYFHGGPWYDFALVNDPIDNKTHIGKILGFFKYKTAGFPTYKHVVIDKMDPDALLVDQTGDDTLYVAVHSSQNFFTEEDLKQKMFTPFSLMTSDDIYIYPITAITKPLMIVPDLGGKGVDYLHCLNKSEWGSLFTKLIKESMD